MLWTVILALNDGATAVIAVLALMVGAFAMARGSGGGATPTSADTRTERAPESPAAATAKKDEAPRGTSFRHGAIRVRDPAAPPGQERIRLRGKRGPQDPSAGG